LSVVLQEKCPSLGGMSWRPGGCGSGSIWGGRRGRSMPMPGAWPSTCRCVSGKAWTRSPRTGRMWRCSSASSRPGRAIAGSTSSRWRADSYTVAAVSLALGVRSRSAGSIGAIRWAAVASRSGAPGQMEVKTMKWVICFQPGREFPAQNGGGTKR